MWFSLAPAAVLAVLLASGLPPAHADDLRAEGKKQFAKCAACHSMAPGVHLMGPSLAGLNGREAGSVEGFAFSPAMQDSGLVWGRDSLSQFLAAPADAIPGNLMPFGGLRKAEQRDALVTYLLEADAP
jgi:cytochrome c